MSTLYLKKKQKQSLDEGLQPSTFRLTVERDASCANQALICNCVISIHSFIHIHHTGVQ